MALVCGIDVCLGMALVYMVREREAAHVAADSGALSWEEGGILDRAKGLEGKCVALTFDDDVIIGLSQEIVTMKRFL